MNYNSYTNTIRLPSLTLTSEYGFYRQLGSLECIRNPHIPPLDPCALPEHERDRTFDLGYRRIPGDQCVGGWEPPRWNQTIVHKASRCMIINQNANSVHGITPTGTGTSLESNGATKNTSHFHIPSKPPSGLDALTHLTHIRPTFMSRLRANGPDVTKLLDAEELAIPSEITGSDGEQQQQQQPSVVFCDPLSGPSGRIGLKFSIQTDNTFFYYFDFSNLKEKQCDWISFPYFTNYGKGDGNLLYALARLEVCR
ncbi:unnamed protein product [Echinostoma caproni]|uniref:Uncharacterized protein n=1 Tax=Echinostoma caproni TaxID=27848 RepID=A0A183AK13_9TREM|nr:unnamed protein product [Echinostoma caproni]